MGKISVLQINPKTFDNLEGSTTTFQCEKQSVEILDGLISMDCNHRYFLTYEEMVDIKCLLGNGISMNSYIQHMISPLRRYVLSGPNERIRNFTKVLLRDVDPNFRETQSNLDMYSKSSFHIENILQPHFESLYVSGELVLKQQDHIGETRGRDAANLIKRTVKQFITSGLKSSGKFNPHLIHDAGDSKIKLRFGDEETAVAFRKIYDLI